MFENERFSREYIMFAPARLLRN